ncbi:hypothetical protein C2G38_2173956 [Gigaspora rosea]|uniref:Uncharacterized protein n=1 Tax=Gigaspora rosea TaxID=44941 RepID=A0A397VTQ9_9GLOM|nr:hypothetical protein C2G38_2173956 [Gigaspora rosea]CAG8512371.1 19456_t:CDS:2 [Gigaspora rosea]
MRSNTNNNSGRSETLDPLYEEKFGISGNANQIANIEARRQKSLANSYELLLELVRDLIPIQGKLEDDIVTIQEKLDIIKYSNQERAEEADENARAYL